MEDVFAIYRDAFFDGRRSLQRCEQEGCAETPLMRLTGVFTAGGPVLYSQVVPWKKTRPFWFMSLDKFRQASGQGPVYCADTGGGQRRFSAR